MDANQWQTLELNGGHIIETTSSRRFQLTPVAEGYSDAQLGDSGDRFFRRPGLTMSLQARFSHAAGALRGTAGFGFWNAPYGDPTRRGLALPRAVWYFYASPPNDLPFAPGSPGWGWFVATIDATTPRALAMIPLAPIVLALNQSAAGRRVWPSVRRGLGIYAAPLDIDMREWHVYELAWHSDGCRFAVDRQAILETPFAPRGPLGFVCWLDNQYLVLTPRGRFRAGTLVLDDGQWMDVADLSLAPIDTTTRSP